jgi:hypothetical protein
MTSCRILNKTKTLRKEEVKIENSIGKTKFFLDTLPFKFWTVLAMWLQIGTPQEK